MDDLVNGLIEAALPSMREKPFAFFGHSLGAIVALETSRALARRAMPQAVHVIVSARPAPHLPLRREPVAGLSRDELKDWLRRVNGTPEPVLENDELMDLFLPTIRADLEIDDTYRSEADPPLTCPLTALGGLSDPEATPTELQAWSSYTDKTFALRLFAGGHFFAFEQGQSAAIAAVTDVLATMR
jgi:surfactin synthase thioesterase subunit